MAAAVIMPKLGLTMETGTVLRWHRREGETIHRGEVLLEVETDKIVNEVESPVSGTLLKVLAPEGTEAKVQAVLAVVGEPGEDYSGLLAGGPLPPADRERAPAGTASAGLHRLTPRARRLLVQAGLSLADLEQLPAGRVTAAAIQELVARRRTEADPAEERESGELVPMSKAQRVVAARMTASFRDVPQFSLRFQAWMDHLLALQPRLAGGGERLTLNDLLLRAVAIALSRSPAVQYQYREEGIWHPGGVHIGFAVASGAGAPGGEELLVPVIRHADRKRVAEIGREAAALAARVREKRQRPEDLAGGTFTVSNLGMFGITSFVPIINPGEGAILGVGALQETPRVRGGSIVSARVVELTLVCDHRSVNGATGAAFCAELKKVLEAEEVGSW